MSAVIATPNYLDILGAGPVVYGSHARGRTTTEEDEHGDL